MKKCMTQKAFEETIISKYGNKYNVITEYTGRDNLVTIQCNKHNIQFSTRAENVIKRNRNNDVCPLCKKENALKVDKVKLHCDLCDTEFFRYEKHLNNSKSGYVFCSRKCKDEAQRIENGFLDMLPNHYTNYRKKYRTTAFDNYEHKCAVCGWNEDERILEVHHIDGNRSNNTKENLIILCPICHTKISLSYYNLVNADGVYGLIKI